MAGGSVLTLQRRQSEQGLCFDGIVAGVRLGEAQRLLDETDRSISEFAQSLGHSNATHLARAFRRFTGMSPREYRNFSRR